MRKLPESMKVSAFDNFLKLTFYLEKNLPINPIGRPVQALDFRKTKRDIRAGYKSRIPGLGFWCEPDVATRLCPSETNGMRQKIMVAEKRRSLKIKSFKPNQGCPLAIWSALIVFVMVIVHTSSLLALSSSRPRERHLEQMLANYEIHYYAPEEFSRKVHAAEPVSFNISNREFRFRLAPRSRT